MASTTIQHHVLEGYPDSVYVVASTRREANRSAGRDRGLWLHAWTLYEDPTCEVPKLEWRRREGIPVIEMLRAHRPELRILAAECGIRALQAYGPVVRREETPQSVVDLLADLPKDAGTLALSAFAADVRELIGRHVYVATWWRLREEGRDADLSDAVELL